MAVNETTHAETTTASGDRSSGDNEVTDIEKKGVPGYAHDSTAHKIENVDDEDNDPNVHQHMNMKLFMSLVCMAFLWCGSQIPLFLFGGVFPLVYSDVGGAERYTWLVIGYLIPVAALCPFVGALSDLFGRKSVAAVGQVLLVIGAIVTSTAKTMNTAIGGMVISGLGAGLNELIALAGTAELVPVRKRGAYVGYIVFTILPFCPSVLWAQLIAADSNWRYVGIFVGGWNFIGLLLVLFAYKDPIRVKRPVKEILGEVDYIGGFLSTAGVTLFMMGLEWGASQYKWTSAHVLVPFCLGIVVIAAFFVWEFYAPHPMLPPAIFSRDKRTMIATLLITFFSGGNFFVVLLFYPTQVYNVYGDDPIGVGVRTLPIGFGIILGAVIALLLLSITRGRSTILMIIGCAVMTLGTGLMSYSRRDNLGAVYGIISIASLGVGFVIIPCSIIAQIVCPKEYIGTITAITLSIRYVGGAIGYGAYYNIFYSRLTGYLTDRAALAVVRGRIAATVPVITELVTLAAQARWRELDEFIASNPAVRNKETVRGILIPAVQESFALAYRFPYWMSIAFGGVCLICSFFLRDVRKYF